MSFFAKIKINFSNFFSSRKSEDRSYDSRIGAKNKYEASLFEFRTADEFKAKIKAELDTRSINLPARRYSDKSLLTNPTLESQPAKKKNTPNDQSHYEAIRSSIPNGISNHSAILKDLTADTTTPFEYLQPTDSQIYRESKRNYEEYLKKTRHKSKPKAVAPEIVENHVVLSNLDSFKQDAEEIFKRYENEYFTFDKITNKSTQTPKSTPLHNNSTTMRTSAGNAIKSIPKYGEISIYSNAIQVPVIPKTSQKATSKLKPTSPKASGSKNENQNQNLGSKIIGLGGNSTFYDSYTLNNADVIDIIGDIIDDFTEIGVDTNTATKPAPSPEKPIIIPLKNSMFLKPKASVLQDSNSSDTTQSVLQNVQNFEDTTETKSVDYSIENINLICTSSPIIHASIEVQNQTKYSDIKEKDGILIDSILQPLESCEIDQSTGSSTLLLDSPVSINEEPSNHLFSTINDPQQARIPENASKQTKQDQVDQILQENNLDKLELPLNKTDPQSHNNSSSNTYNDGKNEETVLPNVSMSSTANSNINCTALTATATAATSKEESCDCKEAVNSSKQVAFSSEMAASASSTDVKHSTRNSVYKKYTKSQVSSKNAADLAEMDQKDSVDYTSPDIEPGTLDQDQFENSSSCKSEDTISLNEENNIMQTIALKKQQQGLEVGLDNTIPVSDGSCLDTKADRAGSADSDSTVIETDKTLQIETAPGIQTKPEAGTKTAVEKVVNTFPNAEKSSEATEIDTVTKSDTQLLETNEAKTSTQEHSLVEIYGSSVSGNREYKKHIKHVSKILKQSEIEYKFNCIAVDPRAKSFIKRKALGSVKIPQFYVDGEFVGFYDDFVAAAESDTLEAFLTASN